MGGWLAFSRRHRRLSDPRGFGAYVYALKYLPVTTDRSTAYVNPLIAVVLGTLVLNEPLTARMAAAAAVVLAGVAIVRRF